MDPEIFTDKAEVEKNMIAPVIRKNDKLARVVIIILSVVVFAAVVVLSRVKLDVNLGFDVHLFATFNAIINTMVSILLLGGLVMVKAKRYELHKRIMLSAIILSALFLVSYICHHLFAGDTRYGGAGTIRTIYFIILITHIFLAAIILPFILFTAYRALTGEFNRHKKLARITWPIWFYVSVTGVIVYLMISPYY
jgi:putative membrane protein